VRTKDEPHFWRANDVSSTYSVSFPVGFRSNIWIFYRNLEILSESSLGYNTALTMRFSMLFRASFWATLVLSASSYTPSSSVSSQILLTAESGTLSSLNRRQWLAKSFATLPAAAAFLSLPSAATAATSAIKLETYNDPTHGFSVQVPADWTRTEQTLPDRRNILLWTDPADSTTFMFIAFTPVRDDFTSLGSFGSVEQVAAQTILPKGKIMGVDVSSEMLSAVSKKQAYFFDYKQCVPGVQPETHVGTIFTLVQGATGGAGAVLVTATVQFPEERYGKDMKAVLETILDSYGKST
jgi:hypothetical protein